MQTVVSGVWREKRLGEETNKKARWDDSGHGHGMGRGRDLPQQAGDREEWCSDSQATVKLRRKDIRGKVAGPSGHVDTAS